ncbi:MAG: pentapeptide repeat-containing protein [Pseudomonadota bacterium]
MAEQATEHHHHDNKWYLRDGEGNSVGPFTTGQIQRWLLLGRLERDTAVSPDHEEWLTIEEYADELVPDVMNTDLSDPYNRDRLEAARRWADERQNDDEGAFIIERRADPKLEEVEMRRLHQKVMAAAANRPKEHAWWLLVVLLLIGITIYFSFFHDWPERDPVTCDAPPAAGVNWRECDLAGRVARNAELNGATLERTVLTRAILTGADLSGADARYARLHMATLTGADLGDAVLLGADLRRADLRRADLRDADLSYADLTGATIDRAKLEGVNLHRATWVDGERCAPGSVGECRR